MSAEKPEARGALVGRVTFATLPYLTLLGCVGIAVAIIIGFEEPHKGLLLVSTLLLATAPLGLALHLVFARELSSEDKRAWIVGLASFKDPGLFAAYFSAAARRDATARLRAKAQGVEPGGEPVPGIAVEQADAAVEPRAGSENRDARS